MEFDEVPEVVAPRPNTSRGLFVALGIGTAVALIVISQVFFGGKPHARFDTSSYEGATAITLAPGETFPPTTVTTFRPVTTVPPTTVAPVSSKFYAADSQFRAAFPSTPTRSSDHLAVNSLSFDLVQYMDDYPDKVFGVGMFRVPRGAAVDLERALAGSALNTGGTLTSSQKTTFKGHPAAEGVITITEGVMRELVVNAGDRVYILFVGGDIDSVSRYQQFRDSLEIL